MQPPCATAAPDSLTARTHHIFSTVPLPHAPHRVNAVHVKSSYSIFCFLPFVHCVVPCFIYFTSFKHYSEDRIINFLLIFSVELISLVSNGFTNNNKCNFHSNSEKQGVCALNLVHIKLPCVMQKLIACWIENCLGQ